MGTHICGHSWQHIGCLLFQGSHAPALTRKFLFASVSKKSLFYQWCDRENFSHDKNLFMHHVCNKRCSKLGQYVSFFTEVECECARLTFAQNFFKVTLLMSLLTSYLTFFNFFLAPGLRCEPRHSIPSGPLTSVASNPLSDVTALNWTSSSSANDRNPPICITDWKNIIQKNRKQKIRETKKEKMRADIYYIFRFKILPKEVDQIVCFWEAHIGNIGNER